MLFSSTHRCSQCSVLLTDSDLLPPLGKHAIPSLVKNLPGGQQTPAKNLSEDTVVSVLNTINEVILDNLEAAKKLRETQGIEKLVLINKSGWVQTYLRQGDKCCHHTATKVVHLAVCSINTLVHIVSIF